MTFFIIPTQDITESKTMDSSTPVQVATSFGEKFEYQKSEGKDKSYKLRNSKRKRLEYIESSSDEDEDMEHIDKKVKLTKQPVNYCTSIFNTYQAKEYDECLKLIEEFLQLPPTHPQYKPEQSCSQYKIIQAACYTMMDINQEETLLALSQIIKLEPKNSFAIYCLGLSQYRNGDLTGCMDSFGTAIDLNPTGAMKRAMEMKAKAKRLMDLLCDGELNCYLSRFRFYI